MPPPPPLPQRDPDQAEILPQHDLIRPRHGWTPGRNFRLFIARKAWNRAAYVASNRVEASAVAPRPKHGIRARFTDGMESTIARVG